MKMLEFIPSYFMEMLKLFLNIIVDTVVQSPRSSKSKTNPSTQTTSNAIHEPENVCDETETEEENTNPLKNGENQYKSCENGKEMKSECVNTFSSKQLKNGGFTINNKASRVVNIFDGTDIHVGDRTYFYQSMSSDQPTSNVSEESEQDIIECDLVTRLKEAEIKILFIFTEIKAIDEPVIRARHHRNSVQNLGIGPDEGTAPPGEMPGEPLDLNQLRLSTAPLEHAYVSYVSYKLGKNWYNIFVDLGFEITTIQSMEATSKTYGARYKLLLEWADKHEENTLGRLATILWEKGEDLERRIVKDLALLYYGRFAC